jgi:peptidyl-prolyl cis-trans isomerase C
MRALTGLFLLVISLVAIGAPADTIIRDGAISMSREEVEFMVRQWPEHLRQAAANDVGDRVELLNMGLAAKKMAADADEIASRLEGDPYWEYVFAVRNLQRRLVFNHFMDNLEVPDMSALAEERYQTEKDKYALVPEQRLSSHILIMCKPAVCDRKEKRPIAEKVLAELRAGGDFEALVKEYSDDPGSKKKGGKFDRWLRIGEPKVDPIFIGGVFGIEKVGGYSDVVETQFGFHIIRLDEIRESYYRTFEEVKPQIIASLEQEYKRLAAKEFEAEYRMSDQAKIDGEAMEEIFAPYRTQDPEVKVETEDANPE